MRHLLWVMGLMLLSPLASSAQDIQNLDPEGRSVCGFFVVNITTYTVDVGIRTNQGAELLTTLESGGNDVISGPCGPTHLNVLIATKEETQKLINGEAFMEVLVPLIPNKPKYVLIFPEGTKVPGLIGDDNN